MTATNNTNITAAIAALVIAPESNQTPAPSALKGDIPARHAPSCAYSDSDFAMIAYRKVISPAAPTAKATGERSRNRLRAVIGCHRSPKSKLRFAPITYTTKRGQLIAAALCRLFQSGHQLI